MLETGNIYKFKEESGTRYVLVLKPEAHPGFARVVLASDDQFKHVTCRMNLPIERFNKSDYVGKMNETELTERIKKARRRSSELDSMLGKSVTITFTDNSSLTGILEYVSDFTAEFGYRRPGYHIGCTSFSKSHVKYIERA